MQTTICGIAATLRTVALILFFTGTALGQLIRSEMIEPEVLDGSVYACTSATGNDSYSCTPPGPAPAAYVTNARYRIKTDVANTGSATANFWNKGAVAIKKWVSGTKSDVATGDIGAGQVVELVFDGTDMVATSLGGGGGVGSDPTPALTEDSNSVNSAKAFEACLGASCVWGLDTAIFTTPLKSWGFPGNYAGTFVGQDSPQTVTQKTIDDSQNTLKLTRSVQMEIFASGDDVVTGNNLKHFRVPVSLNGTNLIGVQINVMTAGVTGNTTVTLTRCAATTSGDICSGSTAAMLTTGPSIQTGENDSSSGTTAVIDTSNDDVSTGQIITVNVTAVSSTAPKGLLVNMDFKLP